MIQYTLNTKLSATSTFFMKRIGFSLIAPFISYSIGTYKNFTSHIRFSISSFHHSFWHHITTSLFQPNALSPFRHYTITPFQREITSPFHHCTIKTFFHGNVNTLRHCIIFLRVGLMLPTIKPLQYKSSYVSSSQFEFLDNGI